MDEVMDNELAESLPEDFEGREGLLNKFGSASDLATAYRNLEKTMGSTTRVPDKDAPQEKWDAYYEKIGVPSSQEGYPLPEEVDSSLAPALQGLAEAAFEGKLSGEQWNAITGRLVSLQAESQQKTLAALEEASADFEKQLRSELGSKADETLALSQRFRDQVFGNLDEYDESLRMVMGVLEKHPVAAKIFAEAARAQGQKNTPSGYGGGMDPSANASEIAAEYRKLSKEMRSSMGKGHPHADQIKKRMTDIQRELSEAGYDGVYDPRLAPKFTLD